MFKSERRVITRRGSSQAIAFLAPYFWPKGDVAGHARVVAAGACLLLAKIATAGVPLVYARAVDALTPKDDALLTVPLALILAYLGLRIGSAAFGELRDAVFAAIQQRTVRRVALDAFRRLHTLSLRFHLDRQTGGMSRAIDRGTQGIEQVLRLSMLNILPTLFELLLVTTIVWGLFDWRFAAVTAGAVGLYVVFTLRFSNWREKFRRRMNDSDSDAQAKALDSLLNYETVKYFGNEALEADRLDTALARYEQAAVKSQVTYNVLNFGQALIMATGLALVMLMAAQGVHDKTMTVGRFVLVNTYLMQLYQPLNFLGFVYNSMKQALIDMEQMFSLLSADPEIRDRADAVAPLSSADAAGPAWIEFENVHFGYGPAREVLKGVSFSVAAGRKLAVVGPTGSGKSTIGRLLFRFYDVTAGRVVVDGHDVRDVRQAGLRAAIGVVPQDTILFNDSIRYNVAYGRPGASEAEIEDAARLAQVHEFVMTLPDGYDTVVGERGLKLSGGEKQRVAIARTLLKKSRILILDEATSSLDSRTEREIEQALRAVSVDRTTLVIAHRLSTVIDADEILVLVHGRVVERGPHTALLTRDGVYAKMWALQAEQARREPLMSDLARV